MNKKEFIKRNEELIELRRVARQFSEIVGGISEMLRLWKRTHVFEDLWHSFRCYEDDQGDIEIYAARVSAALRAAEELMLIVGAFKGLFVFDVSKNIDNTRDRYFMKSLHSTRPTKAKISRLEKAGRDCSLLVDLILDRHWRGWMRKNSGLPLDLAQEASLKMQELLTEVEGNWYRIASALNSATDGANENGRTAPGDHRAADEPRKAAI
jgi:hypothetical protein